MILAREHFDSIPLTIIPLISPGLNAKTQRGRGAKKNTCPLCVSAPWCFGVKNYRGQGAKLISWHGVNKHHYNSQVYLRQFAALPVASSRAVKLGGTMATIPKPEG